VKVTVDEFLCDGHGVCVEACPQVFFLGEEDDQVTVLNEHPEESLRGEVDQAVATCPKGAITLEG
jgi:ferredoxin